MIRVEMLLFIDRTCVVHKFIANEGDKKCNLEKKWRAEERTEYRNTLKISFHRAEEANENILFVFVISVMIRRLIGVELRNWRSSKASVNMRRKSVRVSLRQAYRIRCSYRVSRHTFSSNRRFSRSPLLGADDDSNLVLSNNFSIEKSECLFRICIPPFSLSL